LSEKLKGRRHLVISHRLRTTTLLGITVFKHNYNNFNAQETPITIINDNFNKIGCQCRPASEVKIAFVSNKKFLYL